MEPVMRPGPLIRLSIVIPAYNEQDYLPDCLRHVMAEVARCADPAGVEVLVIDNASTDATAAVAAAVAGVRVVHEPRKGLTRARQAGLEAARGEVLGFVDADTRMPRGWIDSVLGGFAADPAVVCVSGPYVYHDATAVQRAMTRLYWVLLAMPAYWMTRYMAVGGNFAASRAALLRIGGFDTAIAFYGEDTNIARRLAGAGRVRFLLRLTMPTSSRRLAAEGVVATAATYMANFVSEVVLKRPVTRGYRDIR
jgi:glycosyltransferase involved in cell wall biosynthesis